MTNQTSENTDEITGGTRSSAANHGKWSQQTIVDARNVLQTQLSNEPSQQTNDQRSGKSNKKNH